MKRMLIMAMVVSVCSVSGFAEEVEEVWESSLALGFTFNSGNTDNSQGNIDYELRYKPSEIDIARIAANWSYGETDDEKSTENGKLISEHKHLYSEQSYATLNGSVEYDDIADLDYRWVISPGYGYFLLKEEHTFLFVELGPGLIGQKKGGVDEGENWIIRAAERYEFTTENGAKIWQVIEYLPYADDTDTYILNTEVGIEAPLSKKLNLRLVARNTYDSDPAPAKKSSDTTVLGALAFTLL